jgi:hypothetical protein
MDFVTFQAAGDYVTFFVTLFVTLLSHANRDLLGTPNKTESNFGDDTQEWAEGKRWT